MEYIQGNDLLNDFLENSLISGKDINNNDYSDKRFTNLHINNTHLHKVNFYRSSMSNSYWRACHFNDVNLDQVDVSNSVIRLCHLNKASVCDAVFEQTLFENCSAQGCDFSGTNFTQSSLTDTDFNRASFFKANMSGADASYCNMRGADFRLSVLTEANFQDADLCGADFTGAIIENTNFRGANLTGTIFDEQDEFIDERMNNADAKVKDSNVDHTNPAFNSTEFKELVSSIGPIVSQLLKQGEHLDCVDQSKLTADLANVLCSMGVKYEKVNNNSHFEKQVSYLLKKAETVGVAPLLASLKNNDNDVPDLVGNMLEDFAIDMKLNENATTKDLLSLLLSSFINKEARSEKDL